MYNYVFKNDEFYISKDYLGENDKNIELVFENGKLIKNAIIPIEAYKIGENLYFDVSHQHWFARKNTRIQGVIRENNGKKVRLEVFSYGTTNRAIINYIQTEIIKDLDNFWVNPRYCRRIE